MGRANATLRQAGCDVAVPAVPGAALVVIGAKLILGSLEAVLGHPTPPLDRNQRLNPGSGWAPGGEKCMGAVGDAAADQQAACPQADAAAMVFACLKIGQLEVSPVIQPRPFGAFARGQTLQCSAEQDFCRARQSA